MSRLERIGTNSGFFSPHRFRWNAPARKYPLQTGYDAFHDSGLRI